MNDVSKVIAETSFDFANPKLLEDVIAPEIGERLQNLIPTFEKATEAVGTMLKSYASLAGVVTVAGAVGIMVGAVVAAQEWLDGQVEAKYSESLGRIQRAREKFVQTYYGTGGTGWSSALQSLIAPKVPDVKNQVGGWSEADFVAQYMPHYVWMVDKVGSNVLAPTWPTPPMDSPASLPEHWCGGVTFPGKSPLSGFAVELKPFTPGFVAVPPNDPDYISALARRRFRTVQPPIPAMAECGVFWGNAPGDGTLFENKYDTTLFTSGYGIPPGYEYLFSWGTYPYMAWGTSSNGLVNGAKYALSAAAAAVAAAIHAPTPIHCAVDARQVARCYRQWLEVSKIRELPPIPQHQLEDGVYLDEEGLPWSPSDFLFVPRGSGGALYPVPWRVARDIEKAFRSFFKVRRALLFQLARATKATREAAKTSPDVALRAAATFGPPPYSAWDPADPLGDGWRYPILQGVPASGGGGGGGLGGLATPPGSSDPTAAALVGLAGLYAAWRWWRNRR